METEAKKPKLSEDHDETGCGEYLSSICDWSEPGNTAIEYHDLIEMTKISYSDLSCAQNKVESVLKEMDRFEFIGINHDVREFCNPALMLGINSSGHGFINLSSTTSQEVYARLQLKYVFSRCIIADAGFMCEIVIHGQKIIFFQLNRIFANTKDRMNKFAYAITTSGSTGSPKIVMVPHSCIVPNILELRKTLEISKTAKIAQLTSLTFDPSIVEVFLSLSSGGILFMISKNVRNDARKLIDLTFERRVTVLQCTPSLFLSTWCNENSKTTVFGKHSYLKILLLGGESFPKIDVFSKLKHVENKTRIFNIYGITEVSCWASINEIDLNHPHDSVSHTRYLGKPMKETIFQVRNGSGDIVTEGDGMLHIGSRTRICTIDGEETNDLKMPVFRNSGDLVTINGNGKIYYQGRCDSTVKRFGNRVNLTKIETTVLKLSFVKNCSALWHEENHKLYLCISTVDSKATTDSKMLEEAKACLKELPSLYQPDEIKFVENFELTVNGKICTSSLMKMFPNKRKNYSEDLPLQDARLAEKKFEQIWKRHFQVLSVGFLEIGGTSVTALQISNELSELLKIEFPELIGMMLRNVTFQKCVRYVSGRIQCSKPKTDITDNTVNDITASQSDLSDSHVEVNEQTETECSEDSNSISHPEKCEWQKCRGRGRGTRQEQNKIDFGNKPNLKIEVQSLHDLRKCVDASPTIFEYSSGEVYATVGSHSGIIWTTELNDSSSVNYCIELPDRIEASVLVLNDFNGIVGCYDGHVYCVHLKTGEIFWKHKTGDVVKCTAILSDDEKNLFVGSYDRYLYCLSVKDGSKVWTSKASDGSISATPCTSPEANLLFFGTLDGSCVALQQKSGAIVWKSKLENPIFSSPAILQHGDVIFCSVSGELACFDIENGKMVFRYRVDGNVFSHLVVIKDSKTNFENIIVACNNKNIYSIEVRPRSRTPILKYIVNFESPVFATPFWEGGLLVVASTNGILRVLDADRGEFLANFKLNGDVFSSPVMHSHYIVVGCRDNNLYVLKIV